MDHPAASPPVDGDARLGSGVVYVWRNGSNVYYRFEVSNANSAAISYKIRARVHSEGIAPAALKQ